MALMYTVIVHKSLAKPERLRVHDALRNLGGHSFLDEENTGPDKTGFLLDRAWEKSELRVRDAVEGVIGRDTQVEVRKHGSEQPTAPVTSDASRHRMARTWEKLPSVAMTPVSEPFSFRDLTAYISKTAPTKDLIEVVSYDWNTTAGEAFHDTELPWEFADDPKLAFIFRGSGSARKRAILIRASFMKEAASSIEATTWSALIDNLARWAVKRGYSYRSI